VIIFIPALFALAAAVREKRFFRIAGLAAAGIVALAFNWFWIRPMLMFMRHMENCPKLLSAEPRYSSSGQRLLLRFSGDEQRVVRRFYGALHSALLCILLAAGICGIIVLRRRGKGRLAAFFAVSASCLWVYSYYGLIFRAGHR